MFLLAARRRTTSPLPWTSPHPKAAAAGRPPSRGRRLHPAAVGRSVGPVQTVRSLLTAIPDPVAALGLPVLERQAQAFGETVVEWERLDPFGFSSEGGPVHRLTFVLNDGAGLVHRNDGGVSDAPSRAGDLLVTPAGVGADYRWRAPLEVLGVSLNPASIDATLAAASSFARHALELRGGRYRRDLVLVGLAHGLREALGMAGPGTRLFVDSAVQTMLVRLLELQRRGAPATRPPRVGLPAWRLQRAMDFIDASLTQDVSLAEIAQAAGGVSPWHFLRLFRESTGVPPLRYRTLRRVERARRLLRERSSLSLGQIAFDCGFRDQSAFCRVFQRETGQSPKEYRDRP